MTFLAQVVVVPTVAVILTACFINASVLRGSVNQNPSNGQQSLSAALSPRTDQNQLSISSNNRQLSYRQQLLARRRGLLSGTNRSLKFSAPQAFSPLSQIGRRQSLSRTRNKSPVSRFAESILPPIASIDISRAFSNYGRPQSRLPSLRTAQSRRQSLSRQLNQVRIPSLHNSRTLTQSQNRLSRLSVNSPTTDLVSRRTGSYSGNRNQNLPSVNSLGGVRNRLAVQPNINREINSRNNLNIGLTNQNINRGGNLNINQNRNLEPQLQQQQRTMNLRNQQTIQNIDSSLNIKQQNNQNFNQNIRPATQKDGPIISQNKDFIVMDSQHSHDDSSYKNESKVANTFDHSNHNIRDSHKIDNSHLAGQSSDYINIKPDNQDKKKSETDSSYVYINIDTGTDTISVSGLQNDVISDTNNNYGTQISINGHQTEIKQSGNNLPKVETYVFENGFQNKAATTAPTIGASKPSSSSQSVNINLNLDSQSNVNDKLLGQNGIQSGLLSFPLNPQVQSSKQLDHSTNIIQNRTENFNSNLAKPAVDNFSNQANSNTNYIGNTNNRQANSNQPAKDYFVLQLNGRLQPVDRQTLRSKILSGVVGSTPYTTERGNRYFRQIRADNTYFVPGFGSRSVSQYRRPRVYTFAK